MDGSITSKSGIDGLKLGFDKSAKPILTVDVEKYQGYLDDTNMTDAQKEEFLHGLWHVIVNFVELGFGVHPLQEVCGKDAGTCTQNANGAFDAVSSDEPEMENNKDDMRP